MRKQQQLVMRVLTVGVCSMIIQNTQHADKPNCKLLR